MAPIPEHNQGAEGFRAARGSSVVDLSGAAISPDQDVEAVDDNTGDNSAAGPGAHTAKAASHLRGGPPETGAYVRQQSDAPSIMLPNQQRDISHLAIDIGGTLIKLVYFSLEDSNPAGSSSEPVGLGGGRLHFVKFESRKVHDCIEFIEKRRLHHAGIVVRATGGGAYKFADVFEQRLGLELVKEDEMACLVTGTNFLLQAIRDESFTFEENVKTYKSLNPRLPPSDPDALFPYLLVNIGSGVSIIKVVSNDDFERISGSSLGGGAFWGLCALLTGCRSFDEMLKLASKGDSAKVDMLVGDIYGGRDYTSIGLSADTIASSFGRWSWKAAHLRYFIRGHRQTMETISYAIRFWSKGEMKAQFMRHEGYLGALGAFIRGSDRIVIPSNSRDPQVWIERFHIGALPAGGVAKYPPLDDVDEQIPWVEKFVKLSAPTNSDPAAAKNPPFLGHRRSSSDSPPPSPSQGGFLHAYRKRSLALDEGRAIDANGDTPEVGVLHLVLSMRPFPLLLDPENYEPNLISLLQEEGELEYWTSTLLKHLPTLVDHAINSKNGTEEAEKRAKDFELAMTQYLNRLAVEPAVYGNLGLADLLECREEALREFDFSDAYKPVKDSENAAALEVFGDLIAELDNITAEDRLSWLFYGMLAANIFDWGAMACVELYQDRSIFNRYRESRAQLCSQRPFLIDDMNQFIQNLFSRGKPYRRAVIFVDNAGADVVLGILPFARELLRLGTDVVLAANSKPAINDVTVSELRCIVAAAATKCEILASTTRESLRIVREEMEIPEPPQSNPRIVGNPSLYIIESGSGGPCINLRRVSVDLSMMCESADLVILEGMGRAIHTNYEAKFSVDTVKLAMLKNERLAKRFNGRLYDCIVRFEPRPQGDQGLPQTS